MKIRNCKTVLAESLTRRANAWVLILEYFCRFSAIANSRCPTAINIATTAGSVPVGSQKELQWMYEQFCMRKIWHVLMLVWLCLQCYTRNLVLLNTKEPWGQLQKPLCPRQVPHSWPGLQPVPRWLVTPCTALLFHRSPCHTMTSSQLKPAQSPFFQTEKCDWHMDTEDRSLPRALVPDRNPKPWSLDTEVWQTKHLGYIITTKGCCSKCLVWWDSSRRTYKARGSIVLPFVPFSLRKSFFSSLSDHHPTVLFSHFQATSEIPSGMQRIVSDSNCRHKNTVCKGVRRQQGLEN